MDKDHHHGPLEEQQNLAGDRHGLGNPGALYRLRVMSTRRWADSASTFGR